VFEINTLLYSHRSVTENAKAVALVFSYTFRKFNKEICIKQISSG